VTTWIDIELVLVGLVAMLEPATLVASVLVLVLGDRPLRTGFLFFVGGVGATLSVGVLAAFVLGDAAAPSGQHERTWVSLVTLIAGVALLSYLVVMIRRRPDPQQMAHNVERMSKLSAASAVSVIAAGAILANAGPFMLVALKSLSQLAPSTLQYALDWCLFSIASLLPLGIALLLLVVAPRPAMSVLRAARGWIERHARTIAGILILLLGATLIRDGIAGITG
jgi:hypothetical protein